MTRQPLRTSRWNLSSFQAGVLLSALNLAALITHSAATGYYGPTQYLDNGGKNVNASPEFYWDLEVERIASEYKPPEHRAAYPSNSQLVETDGTEGNPRDNLTTDADEKNFAAAVKEGRIKPPDAAKAIEQNTAAREMIVDADDKTTDPLPEEFPSEFADYHRGAFAYREKKWDDARAAWEALLKRPPEERHYRTVWAAFMLGKVELKNADPAAVTWFQKTRALAKEGFADSLGMAADSYGWEGRSEWKQNHPEKAAPLFLAQLALGDQSAIVSLKALIPDREPVEGMLNYGPEPDVSGTPTDEEKRAKDTAARAALKTAAADPLLRRLITAHILATESASWAVDESGLPAPANRCARWLSVLKEINPGVVKDGEYLGWVAYTSGDYEDAAHWLELSKSDSPAACWLRAKLQLRAGKLDDAAKSMAGAWKSIHDLGDYTGAPEGARPDPTEDETDLFVTAGEGWGFGQSAGGDFGALHLEKADFVPALDVFLKAGLWYDTAFVAERVLTAAELKAYVDQMPAISGSAAADGTVDDTTRMRYLLGRRLVREDRYAEAGKYLKPPFDKVLDRYVQAMKDGSDARLPKLDRARAWFTAAWLARYDGMEIMGTEGAPDGFASGGSFPVDDLAKQRRTGFFETETYSDTGNKTVKHPIPLKPSKPELARLAKIKIDPDLRYHYREVAAALAIRAANLLGDNSEELADVVNTAGGWVKDRDEIAGDRYYQILEKRCAGTEIGKAAIAKHWFVDQQGPWSNAQQTAYTAMHKELGIQSEN